ncbi:MAG: hypothetical protein HUU33_06180 [Flavobacteriales bacterium]|nr:hypothetical protein [Flavobacteriales bacterium]
MNMHRWHADGSLTLLGHLTFILLLLLSWWHWDIRIVHVDSAYQVFSWINDPAYKIEAYRYSAVLPQALVKLLDTCGAGMNVLLVAASVTHVLVAYVTYMFCVHVLRSRTVAVAMPLATLLCMHTSFYGMVLEAHYLLSYPFLLLAFWEWSFSKGVGHKPWTWFLSLVLLIPILMVHPTAFAFVLFMALFAFLLPGHTWQLPVAAVLVTGLWAMMHRTWFPPSAYELEFSTNLRTGLSEPGRIAELRSTGFFLDGLLLPGKLYILPLALLLMGVAALLRSGRHLHAIAALMAFPVYLGVVFLSSPYGQQEIMMDKSILPAGLLVALPWVCGGARIGKDARIARLWRVMLVVVLAIKLCTIAMAATLFEDRLARLRQLVEDGRAAGGGVRYITEDARRMYGLMDDWGLPFETVLLSTSDGGTPVMLLPSEPVPVGAQWEQLPFWLQDMHYPLDRERFGVDLDPSSLHALPVFAGAQAKELNQ